MYRRRFSSNAFILSPASFLSRFASPTSGRDLHRVQIIRIQHHLWGLKEVIRLEAFRLFQPILDLLLPVVFQGGRRKRRTGWSNHGRRP